jgi:hypothetical protein
MIHRTFYNDFVCVTGDTEIPYKAVERNRKIVRTIYVTVIYYVRSTDK